MPVFLLPGHAEPGSYDMAIGECTMLTSRQKVLCFTKTETAFSIVLFPIPGDCVTSHH